jgi:hypothetical protein
MNAEESPPEKRGRPYSDGPGEDGSLHSLGDVNDLSPTADREPQT